MAKIITTFFAGDDDASRFLEESNDYYHFIEDVSDKKLNAVMAQRRYRRAMRSM